MAVLSAVLFSCVREEMTCDKELIVVQRIGEGGYVYTRGAAISSNTDLKEETFGLYGSLTPNASVPQPYFNASATERRPDSHHLAVAILAWIAECEHEILLLVSVQRCECAYCEFH